MNIELSASGIIDRKGSVNGHFAMKRTHLQGTLPFPCVCILSGECQTTGVE